MHKEELKQLSEYYLRHILDDVMPFWDARCVDEECGGFFTCFDRQGKLTDDNKYIWFQGRQTYTYALLYNHIEKRQDWLDKARHGFRFLADKAYAVCGYACAAGPGGIQHGPGRTGRRGNGDYACHI